MSVNQLKVIVSVLKEISEDNIPNHTDYELEQKKYIDIIEAMQDAGLIKNAIVIRKCNGLNLENVKITFKGIEYLNTNSTLVKTYKGLKELREWLPF